MMPFPAGRAHSERRAKIHVLHLVSYVFCLVALLSSVLVSNALAAQTIGIAVSPTSVTLAPGATQQFTATLTGTSNTSVNWSASAGTITKSGLFTAPTVNMTSAVTVTATSASDPRQSATATVAVVKQSKPPIAAPAPEITPGPLQQSSFDGPAELPRVYLNSAMSDTPSPGQTWTVKAGGNVQDALNNAACGDIIELQAGASFSASLTVPAKNCDDAHWITVRTSAADSALPAEGTRITPCYAGVDSLPGRPDYNCSNPQNVMAKIVFSKNTGSGPIVFAPGANHYRFIGLEITRNANTPIVYALICPTPGYSVDHLVFDRMWIHGSTHDETNKGVRLGSSTNLAIIDSYFSDFHCTSSKGACTDASAIGGGIGDNAMGPYKIVDNFLEASGENILLGGAAATQTPADIEIRSNHMFKPLIWMKGQPGYVGGKDGYPFIVKNLFELKNAQRVLFEGNVLENSWGGFTQTGYGLLLTPANQEVDGVHKCPSCQVTDITVRYSVISHVASGLQIANASRDGAGASAGERYSIHDLVIDDINPDLYNGFGLLAQVSMGPTGAPTLQHVNMEHITAFPKKVLLTLGSKTTTKMVDFNFVNNMVLAGDVRPFTSTGGGTYNCAQHVYYPITLFNGCFTSWQLTSNGIIAVPSTVPPQVWPDGNYFPQSPQGLFVNYNGGNGGDYHLVNNSPYKAMGTDGADLGANIDLVNQYTANSR